MADMTAYYIRPGHIGKLSQMDLPGSAKVLLEFGADRVEKLVSVLTLAEGYVTLDRLKSLISDTGVEKPWSVMRIAELILDGAKNSGDSNVSDRYADSFVKALRLQDDEQQVNDEHKLIVHRLLATLIRPYPALLRQAKAERLADAVNLRAEAVDLICDLRPVFDDERCRIEGLIPMTTIKIVASGVDRFPISFEAVLSARDVLTLQKKVQDAVDKLNKLGEFAERNEMTIPAVTLTETEKSS